MPYKDKKKAREYMRQWRQNHKDLGLCWSCNKSVIEGLTECPTHHQQHLIRKKRDYMKYRASDLLWLKQRQERFRLEGKCIRCGAPLMADESTFCFACRASYHQIQIKGVLKYETAN